ncbi:MAG: DNA repair protein RadA [Flavobacteriaceae bacterium]|jgi:DNA repair protein RadA/Sms|nr:DNA repair protein RadA [Flavobacteriaceae bacterium]
MAKVKTAYFCQNCGAQSAQWKGQCSACKEWNTLVEETISPASEAPVIGTTTLQTKKKAQKLDEINFETETRIDTRDQEFNRVLGGGLVPGSVILLGGEPGIGKSTLLLQIALSLGKKVLYVSGEESEKQIKLRADRIQSNQENCYVLAETKTDLIGLQIESVQPDLIIVDSVQTLQSPKLESASGTVSQIRECTAELTYYAKATGTPLILVGHITKDGQLAGPKLLEHMVDTVLQFEGDRNYVYRILRALKNRFGSTAELGIYEMLSGGLREVTNPSELLLSNYEEPLSGVAVAATLEGQRPLMIEIQALVSTAVYGTPQRSATGFNSKRLNMLLAVLEKKVGFKLGTKDVFLNITGGIHIDDPAIDLGVVMAVLSSNADKPLPASICFAAEVGLAGEIRSVQSIDRRIAEAEKLGFKAIFVASNASIDDKAHQIRIIRVSKIEEVVAKIFSKN